MLTESRRNSAVISMCTTGGCHSSMVQMQCHVTWEHISHLSTCLVLTLFLIIISSNLSQSHTSFLIAKEIFTAKCIKKSEYNPILRSFIDRIADKHHDKNKKEQENWKAKIMKMDLNFPTHLIHKYYSFHRCVLQCHWADSVPKNFT